MAKQLSEPQQRLLAEIRDSPDGGLYIWRTSRCFPTARALVRMGLIEGYPQWGTGSWEWYEPLPIQRKGVAHEEKEDSET